MKNIKIRNSMFKLFAITLLLISLPVLVVEAQENRGSEGDLEEIQDRNMEYLNQINEITKNYPAFSYSYKMEDGKLSDVIVTGVESSVDRKRLEIALFDLKSSKNMIKNKANRIGVFYSVDEGPEYKAGDESLNEVLTTNLNYPEEAKNWGVEGTIYVKFVVDENGEIPFATTSSNIETSIERYLTDLEKQAVSAIKATSGDWEPGKVSGVNVAALAVVPVTFDFEKNPVLPALIR